MKNKITKLFLVLMLSGFAVHAQDTESLEKILSNTNTEFLSQYEIIKKKEALEDYNKAYKIAIETNKPIKGVDESGYKFQLIGVDGETNGLIYYRTFNNTPTKSSLQTANAKPLQALGLTGNGINVGVWDGGTALTNHLSLVGRVQMKESVPSDDHATHVTGTIAANSYLNDAKGFATEATIWAYDYFTDVSEITAAAKLGLLVSNHSYGLDAAKSPSVVPGIFGRYDSRVQSYDVIANNNPMYTMVFAAGNDRTYNFNPGKGGRDLLSWGGVAKNTIVVASTKGTENFSEVATPTSPVNFLSIFSSWGPTDDFRIKPDIAAKGDQVYSLTNTGVTATAIMSGTSMAAPAVTGVVVLWQQYFKQLFGQYMRSATVRAIMAHSAREAGEAEGPDYKFGWGLINADGGAQVMREKSQDLAALAELTMNQGETLNYEFEYDGNQPLIATIAWNDPAGSALNTTNSNIASLVNDLDLKVINMDTNQEFLPWALNHSWTSSGSNMAARMVNSRDNIERVNVNSTIPGNYKIVVTHKGNLSGGKQDFSLIVSGTGTVMDSIGNLAIKEQNFTRLSVYPNPTVDFINLEGEFSELHGAEIVIYDLTGKKVFTKNNAFDSNREVLNVTNLTSGVYLMDVYNNNRRQVIKLVKK